MSLDGERNNERYVPARKERPAYYTPQDMSGRNDMSAVTNGSSGRDNTIRNANINREEGVRE